MAEKHSIFHGQFIKNKDKLVVCGGNATYQNFVKTLEEGQRVEIFMEADVDNGTVAQLAKIHVCIRELAKELGYSYEDMKLEIKRQAGLCVKKDFEGERFMVCKSFAHCSKDELALAVEAIVQIGDMAGINFR